MEVVEGKVAFITGGASGMGLAMTRSFSAAGMKVVVADIEEAALQAVETEFAGSNSQVLPLQVDVTDRAQMARAADDAEKFFGKIHVLCNNAGVAVTGNVQQMSYEDWDWVVNVNLQGVVNGLVTFLDRIRSHGEGGHVVNTASMAGQIGIAGMSVYNSTKFAVVGISESIRGDLASSDIGVSVLCPGLVATNIFTSERNRPAKLTSGEQAASLFANSDDEQFTLDEIMSRSMDPGIVGEMVLHAIQTNEFYIFTHPEFKAVVAERGNQLAESFNVWEKWIADKHKGES